jgi:hypothetical protein
MIIIKNYCEKIKKLSDTSFKIFPFKSVLVVSVCFLIFIIFYISSYTKLPLKLYYNDEKTIMQIQKHLLTSILNLLLPKIFCLFHYAIEIKKKIYFFPMNLVMTIGPYEKTSISLKTSINFFG